MRGKMPREDVKVTGSLLYDASGEPYFKYGFLNKPDPESFSFMVKWTKGVLDGMQAQKEGKRTVPEKWVYRIAETPNEPYTMTL